MADTRLREPSGATPIPLTTQEKAQNFTFSTQFILTGQPRATLGPACLALSTYAQFRYSISFTASYG